MSTYDTWLGVGSVRRARRKLLIRSGIAILSGLIRDMIDLGESRGIALLRQLDRVLGVVEVPLLERRYGEPVESGAGLGLYPVCERSHCR